eukprot:2221423-Rhodomonas_salina.1
MQVLPRELRLTVSGCDGVGAGVRRVQPVTRAEPGPEEMRLASGSAVSTDRPCAETVEESKEAVVLPARVCTRMTLNQCLHSLVKIMLKASMHHTVLITVLKTSARYALFLRYSSTIHQISCLR